METWAAGNRLGPYELVARVGVGGMGEVWKAQDTRLGRPVAIKRLKNEHSGRFEREAQAIAALNHPNICQLYDIGTNYLVMEYIEGTPLRSPIPTDDAVRVAIQVAAALEEAHRRGIIHRDLKPGNIMITPDGVAKLLDFGLAKTANTDPDATGSIVGTVTGTPSYMAPEQAEGRPLDERSDVFSFGAVLYELLSGRRTFEGNSTAEVLSSILRDDPKPIGLAGPIERIVMRCLRKAPDQRFQTMAELRHALETLPPGSAQAAPSIAVLPFADMSPDSDNEYFSDGLTEEIINALVQIPLLRVIARTSAFAFKGQNSDIRGIAEALGVTHILEGSVRKAGSRVRVTAQLIAAADGSHLWSHRYDREMVDVFALQDEIAQAIGEMMEVKLSVTPAAARRHQPKLAAYEAFLKGRHYWAKLTPESFERSREYYEQAIALDPQFALAHAFLGDHFFGLAIAGLPPGECTRQAREHARKALDLDPTLAEARAVLALCAATYDHDWDEAGRQFRRALERAPVAPEVRAGHAFFYLLQMGQTDRALAESRRAIEEDPLNIIFRLQLAFCLVAAGKTDEAVGQLGEILEIDANYHLAYWLLGTIAVLDGNAAQALAYAERCYALAPWGTWSVGLLAGVLSQAGDTNRAESLQAEFKVPEAYGTPIMRTYFHLGRGDIETAAEWIERAIEQHDPRVLLLLRQFFQTSLRWPRLVKRTNLPVA